MTRRLLFAAFMSSGCAALESWDQFAREGSATADASSGDGSAGDAGGGDASSADVGPSFVQFNAAYADTSSVSLKVPFARAQGAGDLVVVVVGWYDSERVVGLPTDTSGNSYALAVGPTVVSGPSPVMQSIYYARGVAAAGPGANVLTVTWSAPDKDRSVRVAEYAGLDRASPLDAVAEGTGNGPAPTTSVAVTHFPVELVVGAGTANVSFAMSDPAFIQRSTGYDLLEDRVVTAAGSYSASASLSSSDGWVMQAATFH